MTLQPQNQMHKSHLGSLEHILLELSSREPIFHRPEHGTDRETFENMTDDNFWEIGASGKRYARQECIDTVVERYKDPNYIQNDQWETRNFKLTPLSSDTYLLTYTLAQDEHITQRCTIWTHVNDCWKMVYHQGTIVSAP